MPSVKITLPLNDIRASLESRLHMLKELEVVVQGAIARSRTPSTRQHNEGELKRITQKMIQLEASKAALMDACCPNSMDCEHQIIEDDESSASGVPAK